MNEPRSSTSRSAGAQGTDVSVVVPTQDRRERLAALLESLREQTLPARAFEVVVVDDASSDGTTQLLERETACDDLRLRVIRRKRPLGPAAARNEGWRAARSPLIAFMDDDCVATPSWLESGLRAYGGRDDTFVQGRTDPNPEELHLAGPFSRTVTVHAAGPTFPTCNVFYPRALLERVGGFDEETFSVPGGEDTDLAWRAIATGARPTFASGAQAFHAVAPLGPIGKLRVAFRWTETMRTFARHPELRRQQLTYRLFWKGSHYLLVRALTALLVPRRHRLLRAWLARPYLFHLLDRGRVEGGGPLMAPYFLLHDLVELAAVLRGAVRYRTPVL